MCFSAQASFGAAAALAGIGVVSIRAAPSRAHVPLAAVPLLFAAQQASEGALWLILEHAPFGKSDTVVARAFLFFALFVWPAYLPLALRAIEARRARRRILAALAAFGVALGAYLMGCASLRPSDACIAFDNIYYWVQLDVQAKPLVPYAYAASIAAPLLVSTVRGTTALALVALASFALTGALYRAGFISVWCFFAAMISGVVALVVRLSRPSSTASPAPAQAQGGGEASRPRSARTSSDEGAW